MRICPKRDAVCPHGVDCPFTIDQYECRDEAPDAPSPISADAVVEACAKAVEGERLDGPIECAEDQAYENAITHAAAAIRALKGTFPAVDGWRTMDSAPKDGSPFVAINIRYLTGHHITIYKWDGPPNYWHAKQQGTCIRPDYQDDYRWTSLPAAPSTQDAAVRSSLVDPEGGV